jgi:hypothetical protein
MLSRTTLSAVLLAASCQSPPEYDVLIVNGTVLDGTGAPGARADVAIANGVIEAVGPLEGARAKRPRGRGAPRISPDSSTCWGKLPPPGHRPSERR